MNTKIFKLLLFAFFIFGANGVGISAPNSHFLPNLFINQISHGGGVPNGHAAFYKYFNSDGVVRINFGAALSGVPVELDPGEAAMASQGWLMFFIDDCEDQVVRQVIDFESEQCQVSDPFEVGPEIALSEVANLPEECLAPPEADSCAAFEGSMRYDFATSQKNARQILKDEIFQAIELDGNLLPSQTRIKPLQHTLNADEPDNPLVCADEVQITPLYAYFFYGYQIPPQSGGCITKITGAALPPLSPGEHQLLLLNSVGGEPQEFPPVTIIQH